MVSTNTTSRSRATRTSTALPGPISQDIIPYSPPRLDLSAPADLALDLVSQKPGGLELDLRGESSTPLALTGRESE